MLFNFFFVDADGTIRKFHDMKTEWGFAKNFPLDTFNDVSHGYLVNDCCVFGVEVFVHKRSNKRECVSVKDLDKPNSTETSKNKITTNADKDRV